jgi:glycosyltransferase involved in cell wall biosynthesis
MAGSGTQVAGLLKRAEQLGVMGRCEFLDPYCGSQERERFFESLDVFVLPSLAEGTPNSVIEAMALGLPVVASAVGGVPDLVTQETGVLVEPGDPEELADALLRIASDPDRRRRMGLAAIQRCRSLFSCEAVLPLLTDVYRRIIFRKQSSPQDSGVPDPPLLHPWAGVVP